MTIRNYTIGFVTCVLLTAASFALVSEHIATGHLFPTHAELLVGLCVLALMQLVVQLRYFLHLGRESRLRNWVMLAFAATIVITIVGGSLWIMANLMHSESIPYIDSQITAQNSND